MEIYKNDYEDKEIMGEKKLFRLLQDLNKKITSSDSDENTDLFVSKWKDIDEILETNKAKFSQTLNQKYLLSERCLGELNQLFEKKPFGIISYVIKEDLELKNLYKDITEMQGSYTTIKNELDKFYKTKNITEKEVLFNTIYRKYFLYHLEKEQKEKTTLERKESSFDYNIKRTDYTDFNIKKNEKEFQYNGKQKDFDRQNIYLHEEKNGSRLGDSPKKKNNRPANIYLSTCKENYTNIKNIPDICNEETFIKAIILQECSHKNYNATEAESEIPSLEIGGIGYLGFRLPKIIEAYYTSNTIKDVLPGYSGMYNIYAETLKELISKDEVLTEKMNNKKEDNSEEVCTANDHTIFYEAFSFLLTEEFTTNFINLYKKKVKEVFDSYKQK